MSEKKYLRRYNNQTGKWTNQCYPYNEAIAGENDLRLIDEAEYKECQKALLEEKRLAVLARRAQISVDNPIKMPPLNKQDAPVPAPEPKTPLEVVTETAVDDGLSGKTKLELQNIIDTEDLPVKKTYGKPELIVAIRLARQAKAEEEANKVAPPIEKEGVSEQQG